MVLVMFGGWNADRMDWNSFIGGNAFCLKACDPSKPNDAKFCEHKLDRIGCAYNAPNNARNGTFESCDSENQDYPGVYTVNGAVQTYTQPPEALGPITTMPYTARVPASSNCVQHTSAAIYTALPKVGAAAGSSSSAGATSNGSGSASSKPTGSATGTAAGASKTSNSGHATAVGMGMVAVMMMNVITLLLV